MAGRSQVLVHTAWRVEPRFRVSRAISPICIRSRHLCSLHAFLTRHIRWITGITTGKILQSGALYSYTRRVREHTCSCLLQNLLSPNLHVHYEYVLQRLSVGRGSVVLARRVADGINDHPCQRQRDQHDNPADKLYGSSAIC